jgi:hypothetical protein
METLLEKLFKHSIQEFFANELSSILNNVSERNLCARLAMYLQDTTHRNNLLDYYADPEYNPKQDGRLKTILDDNYCTSPLNGWTKLVNQFSHLNLGLWQSKEELFR